MSSKSASTSKPFRLFGFISPRTLLYTGAAVLVALFMKKYGDGRPSSGGRTAPPPEQEETRLFLEGTALSAQEARKPSLLLLDNEGVLKSTADEIRTAFGGRCTITYIDITGRPDVLEYYKAESTPLALLVSPDGTELGRLEAPISQEKLEVFLQEELATPVGE